MNFRDITPLQWIGIIILFNGTLVGGSSYLADLFLSAAVVKAIIAMASLGNMFLGGLVTMFSGQGSQIKSVLAMPGVEHVSVNAQAGQTLAALAVNPSVDKIAPTRAAQQDVEATAKGT